MMIKIEILFLRKMMLVITLKKIYSRAKKTGKFDEKEKLTKISVYLNE